MRIHDGTLTFRAPGIQTKDALTARHIDGSVSNLTNVADSTKETFARFHFDAQVLEDGRPLRIVVDDEYVAHTHGYRWAVSR